MRPTDLVRCGTSEPTGGRPRHPAHRTSLGIDRSTRTQPSSRGRAFLAAAWDFACGIAYDSIAAHWLAMRSGRIDPAPIPTEWVFGIKLLGGLVFVLGLVLTVTHAQPAEAQ